MVGARGNAGFFVKRAVIGENHFLSFGCGNEANVVVGKINKSGLRFRKPRLDFSVVPLDPFF